MRLLCLLTVIAVLHIRAMPVRAVIVTNVTTDTVIFNSSGFEHDAAGHPPEAILQKSPAPKLWRAVTPWDEVVSTVDRYVHRLPPFADGGFRYLQTRRDEHGAGNPVALFSTNQNRPGDVIRMEFCMELPVDVDATIKLGHDESGAVRGLLRIHDGRVQFHDGAGWHDVQPRVTFLPKKWQTWTLEYVIGAETFSVCVEDGPLGAAPALESMTERGAGGLNRLEFGHLRKQTFCIDASEPMRSAAAIRRTEVQASQDLPQLLEIRWRLGPDLEQGVQTVATGIVHDMLVWTGGFCSGGTLYPGNRVPGKLERYPRGYVEKTWGLNLKHIAAGWQQLPPMIGPARQAQTSAVVDDALYAFGGITYAELAHRDGYRLGRDGDAWRWDRLPDLPWKIAFAGAATAGKRILLFGGTDMAAPPEPIYHTVTSIDGKTERLGAQLISLDTENLNAGWQTLPACPGTPRFMPATAVVGEHFYVFGGLSGFDNAGKQINVVVDNWRFHLTNQNWERLDDLPVASTRHPNNYIVFQNRYILLISGAPTRNVINPDGTMRSAYGRPHRTRWGKTTYSDITVYDTQTRRFGRATPLPLCNNMPNAVLHGSTLYLIGGECEGVEFNGIHYGHHPDLLLIGDVSVVPTGS